MGDSCQQIDDDIWADHQLGFLDGIDFKAIYEDGDLTGNMNAGNKERRDNNLWRNVMKAFEDTVAINAMD